MYFVSITFIIFLIILFPIYFNINYKYKWILLLLASYIFYSFANITFLIFLLISTISTFLSAVIISNLNKKENIFLLENANSSHIQKENFSKKINFKKNIVLSFAIIINIGLIIFFKQAKIINDVMNISTTINLILPLGISFYTLQAMGYTIDVYRNVTKPETNIAKYALFVSYFPQFLMGPISRFNDLHHQFFLKHSFDKQRFIQGVQRIIWGFFKKLVIADRISIFINMVFSNYTDFSVTTLIIANVLCFVQLYTDFSSYMDIAIGVSKCLGIDIQENFKSPFFSKSIQEFWTRWHITLYTWFRDYVFYSLIRSKPFIKLGDYFSNSPFILSSLPITISILIVWILIGLWHGFQLSFIINNIFGGIALVIYMFIHKYNIFKNIHSSIKILSTFIILNFGVFFLFLSFNDITNILYTIFHNPISKNVLTELNSSIFSVYEWSITILGIIILLIVDFIKYKNNNKFIVKNIKYNFIIIYVLLVLIVLFGIFDGTTFIYLRF